MSLCPRRAYAPRKFDTMNTRVAGRAWCHGDGSSRTGVTASAHRGLGLFALTGLANRFLRIVQHVAAPVTSAPSIPVAAPRITSRRGPVHVRLAIAPPMFSAQPTCRGLAWPRE